MKYKVHILLPNIRSAHNVGSIFRSSDCFNVQKIYMHGTTPMPIDRFGNITEKAQKDIAKTALGAEKTIEWEYVENIKKLINNLKKDNFYIVSIEQNKNSISINEFKRKIKKEKIQNILCIFGNEVLGIEQSILNQSDSIVEISMKGKKESLNVSVCAGIILFSLN